MITDNLFKGIFENSPVPLILTDSQGTILEVNHCAITLIGYDQKELINSNIKELFPYKLVDGNRNDKLPFSSFEDIIKTHNTTHEFVIQKKNGKHLFAELNLTSFDVASEKLLIWSAREIFEDKKMIFDLRERMKEQLALLSVTETLFKCNDVNLALNECVTHIRNGWQFPEYTVVRIKLNDGLSCSSEGFIETKWALLSDIPNHGTIEVYYTTEVPAYGDSIFLQEEKKLIDGLAKLLSLFLDQLHAINQLKEKETLIRKITNQIPANTYQFEIDENGNMKILFATKGVNELLHEYKIEDLVKNPLQFIYEDDRNKYIQSLKDAYENLSDLSVQYRIIFNDKIYWRWLRASHEINDSGKVIWYGSSQDITPIIDYIDVLEQIIFDISHVIRRPVTTLLAISNLIENVKMTKENITAIVEKFKVVVDEMDEYTKYLNEAYNEKKLSTTEFEMRLQFLNKRIDLFNTPNI